MSAPRKPSVKKERGKNLLQGRALNDAVKRALESHTPWKEICKRFHIGVKTIQKIRDLDSHGEDQGFQESRAYAQSAPSMNERTESEEQELTPGEIASRCFKIFRKGGEVIEAVIQLGIEPEVASSYFAEYHEYSEFEYFTKESWDVIFNQPLHQAIDFPSVSIRETMEKLVRDHNDLLQFKYNCSVCGQPIQADQKIWKWILEHGFIKIWGHSSCFEKSN